MCEPAYKVQQEPDVIFISLLSIDTYDSDPVNFCRYLSPGGRVKIRVWEKSFGQYRTRSRIAIVSRSPMEKLYG